MQRKMFVFAIAALFLAPLSALADQEILGVPDFTCQPSYQWNVHDYGPPATGLFASLPATLYSDSLRVSLSPDTPAPLSLNNPLSADQPWGSPIDGNLEECGNTYGWFLLSDEDCALLLEQVGGDVNHPLYVLLCRTDRLTDWDGDAEYAIGGAYLVSSTGDGITSGGLACYDALGHHPQGANVYVNDLVFANVFFTVTADFTDPSDPPDPTGGPDCGDNVIQPCDPTPPDESSLPQPVGGVVDTVNGVLYSLFNSDGTTCTAGDVSKPCLNRCVLDFPPGTDGSYIVFVGPSLAGNGGEPTGATQGHVTTGVHWWPPPPPPPGSFPLAGGPMFTSTFGGAPNLLVPPGWKCFETLPWTGGNTGSGSVEVVCSAFAPADFCQQPLVTAYVYSGVGRLTAGTGCDFIDTSCEANIGLSEPADVLTCTARSESVSLWGRLVCRADIQQETPYYAWAVHCTNDP